MSKKAFILTLDAVYALGAVAVLSMLFLSFYGGAPAKLSGYSHLESQARDYLWMNYEERKPLTPAQFNDFTKHYVSELPPAGADAVRSTIIVYPDICNCQGASECPVVKTNACLASQEPLANTKKQAWVK